MEFRVSITHAAGPETDPIASLTWLLVRKQPADSAKQAKLKEFLAWMLTPEAQRMAADLNSAPLPVKLIEVEQQRVSGL